MRSNSSYSLSSPEVHGWARGWLLQATLIADHGWKCTAALVLDIVLRAAARSVSVHAACRDLSEAPSDRAVMTALDDELPKTPCVLEQRLNAALVRELPRRMRRRKWELAIDYHLSPYYGQPQKSPDELCPGKPRQGTKKFHGYASACIVEYGHRYTLALTSVCRSDTEATVLARLIERVRQIGIKIRCVLVDRAFFNVAVVQFLQGEKLPFLMPVMIRGRRPKKGKPLQGLRWIRRQNAGWYTHTMKNGKRQAIVKICVGYRQHKNRKDHKQKKQKLLFAAWRIRGTPTEIRERYRKRFGIETSYRQMRQGRIYTCTRNPRLRLFFVAVSLLLRNLWVWLHALRLAEGPAHNITLHLERLRFKRMLDWIAFEIVATLHDGSSPYVEWPP